VSSNWLPPTQTLLGVEHSPDTALPDPLEEFARSHPAAPLSPEETNDVMPWAAACCQRLA
jgi:hypothetical protein